MSDTPLTSFDFQFVWDKNPAVALLQLLLLQLPPYDGHLALGNAEPFGCILSPMNCWLYSISNVMPLIRLQRLYLSRPKQTVLASIVLLLFLFFFAFYLLLSFRAPNIYSILFIPSFFYDFDVSISRCLLSFENAQLFFSIFWDRQSEWVNMITATLSTEKQNDVLKKFWKL